MTVLSPLTRVCCKSTQGIPCWIVSGLAHHSEEIDSTRLGVRKRAQAVHNQVLKWLVDCLDE